MDFKIHFFQYMGLCTILVSYASGTNIRFYRDHNYTGLTYESFYTEKCINFPGNGQVASFTTDVCYIQYWHADYKSTKSWKIMPGNYSAPIGQHYLIRSFQLCDDDEGGLQLNVDITKYYEGDEPTNVPEVLEKYKKVCTCINIPDYVHKMDKWSIDNHHNYFIVYFEPDCLKDKLAGMLFPPGHYDDIRNIYNYTNRDNATAKLYNIQSFGPYPNSTYFRSSCQGTFEFLLQSHLKDFEGMENINRILEQDNENIKAKLTDLETQNLVLSNKIVELEIEVKSSEFKLLAGISAQKNEFENLKDNIKRDLMDIFA